MEINREAFIAEIKNINSSENGPIITDSKSLDLFLQEFKIEKNLELRFIAYCLKLKCINFETYAEELLQKILDYEKESKEILGNFYDDPLKATPENVSKVITADVPRSFGFFNEICKDMGVKSLGEEYGHLASKRIHSIIALKYPKLSYIQGYDRYTLICFSLALKIVQSLGIDNHYAEGLCFDLIIKFIQISSFNIILEHPHEQVMFTLLDNGIRGLNPRLYDSFKESHMSSLYFAMSWRLLFFTHVHPTRHVLLIWDRFLLHSNPKTEIDLFFVSLALAHIKQVISVLDNQEFGSTTVELIQAYQNYDLNQIFVDADEFFNNPPKYNEDQENDLAATAVDVLQATAKFATKVAVKVGIRILKKYIGEQINGARAPVANNANADSPSDFTADILSILSDLYM
ncbi:hypothetical protein TVAG_096940 [Trichomonas vaginalis G3]|uniref:Rab-GAP TBC domain-containing protein n=1 Tax=Trichomonas vaginalis (strain ATCC PRA-98 / G3) TaxID=412133 RepID=A2FWV2_TRIV3|nr:TBC domain-containing protein kinase-like protein family [Trichomonas vaginalis G3]EAX90608.1 hypothetical protein TVAG_096940 [Trichomonas vaginalis G3]KAI5547236.1 TBC domain-containing protein kinase-like protein family [Trichomonas vaginalis G3]|eukprot:XP_001303538.1 hypothetical protein [Trichomonas vaginalis G3]